MDERIAFAYKTISFNFDYATRIRLSISPNGTAEVDGIVKRPNGSRLKASQAPADCACADLSGNDLVGVTRLQFEARHPRNQERVPVVLETIGAADIDEPGRYDVVWQVGDHVDTVAVGVQFLEPRRKCRRRRRRKGRCKGRERRR